MDRLRCGILCALILSAVAATCGPAAADGSPASWIMKKPVPDATGFKIGGWINSTVVYDRAKWCARWRAPAVPISTPFAPTLMECMLAPLRCRSLVSQYAPGMKVSKCSSTVQMSGTFNYDPISGNFMMVVFQCTETSTVKVLSLRISDPSDRRFEILLEFEFDLQCGLCKSYANINWDSGRMYFKTAGCRDMEIHSNHRGVTDIFRFTRVTARAPNLWISFPSPSFSHAVHAEHLADYRVPTVMQVDAKLPLAVRLEKLLS
jgi:hypothetical protein